MPQVACLGSQLPSLDYSCKSKEGTRLEEKGERDREEQEEYLAKCVDREERIRERMRKRFRERQI